MDKDRHKLGSTIKLGNIDQYENTKNSRLFRHCGKGEF